MLSLIRRLFDQLRQAKIYLKINLRGAYNLVYIKEGDEWRIAFWTRYGHFEYNVMFLRLIDALAIFRYYFDEQRLMWFLDDFVVYSLDNILIYYKNIEEYKEHIKFVLQKLQEARLYAKLKKYLFHQRQVEFLDISFSIKIH